jgi:IS1 family transposase
LSIAIETGLIIASIIGKHTDKMIEGLVNNTEGKTACKNWKTDDWGGYERVLSEEINHEIGKENTQRLERINGIGV